MAKRKEVKNKTKEEIREKGEKSVKRREGM